MRAKLTIFSHITQLKVQKTTNMYGFKKEINAKNLTLHLV